MENINIIEIGKTRAMLNTKKWVSAFSPRNKLIGASSYGRTNDGTLQYKNVDTYYQPQGDFEFSFETPEEFAEAVQLINSTDFVIRYYDPEILMWVVRKVKMTQHSIDLFLSARGQYKGAVRHKFSVESIYGYDSYDELKSKALTDSRF